MKFEPSTDIFGDLRTKYANTSGFVGFVSGNKRKPVRFRLGAGSKFSKQSK